MFKNEELKQSFIICLMSSIPILLVWLCLVTWQMVDKSISATYSAHVDNLILEGVKSDSKVAQDMLNTANQRLAGFIEGKDSQQTVQKAMSLYFHDNSKALAISLHNQLLYMAKSAQTATFQIAFCGDDSSVIAYTMRGDTHEGVSICPTEYNAIVSPRDRGETLIHEWAHQYLGASDYRYATKYRNWKYYPDKTNKPEPEMSKRVHADDIRTFDYLPTSLAIQNADSIARFVASISDPRPTGAASPSRVAEKL